jgi:dipeptide/tripeptide permease
MKTGTAWRSAFGADQFNEADPQDRKEKESFFNYFYLAINIGSLVASTVVVWIQDQASLLWWICWQHHV